MPAALNSKFQIPDSKFKIENDDSAFFMESGIEIDGKRKQAGTLQALRGEFELKTENFP